MSSIGLEDLIRSYNNLNSSEKESVKDGSFNHRFFNNEFSGYKVIEDVNLVNVEIDIIQRSWKERLLTLPWKPWVNTKVVEKKIPKQEVYIVRDYMNAKIIVCHPVMINQLKESLSKVERLWLCDYGA